MGVMITTGITQEVLLDSPKSDTISHVVKQSLEKYLASLFAILPLYNAHSEAKLHINPVCWKGTSLLNMP